MQRRTLLASGAVVVAAGTAVVLTTTGPDAVAAGSPAGVLAPVGGSVTSAAGAHDPVYYIPEADALGDVAMDIGADADTPVHPRIEYEGEGDLVLTVAEIHAACTSSDGGDAVRVDVSTNGTTVGSVTYAHLAGVSVAVGDPVSADTQLGLVAGGLPVHDQCWTGPHMHVEWGNHEDWACYIARSEGEGLDEGALVGRIGGDFGEGQGAVCP